MCQVQNYDREYRIDRAYRKTRVRTKGCHGRELIEHIMDARLSIYAPTHFVENACTRTFTTPKITPCPPAPLI